MATDRELTVADWTPEQLEQVQVVDAPALESTIFSTTTPIFTPTAFVTPAGDTYAPN